MMIIISHSHSPEDQIITLSIDFDALCVKYFIKSIIYLTDRGERERLGEDAYPRAPSYAYLLN